MKKSFIFILIGFVSTVFIPVSSDGASLIPIDNPGFEIPVLTDGDWTYSLDNEGWGYVDNDGYIGAWNPQNADYVGEAPEGENVGWAEPGAGVPGGFAQVLLDPEAVLKAGTTYTLTVEVGAARTYTSGGYKVQLLAGGTPHTPGTGDYTGPVTGGTLLAEDDNTLSPIKAGSFEMSTVIYTYNAALHSHLLGEPLQIRLLALTGGDETEFDDVKLSYESGMATNPTPADGAEDVPVDTDICWTPGDDVLVHEIYFGTDPNDLPHVNTQAVGTECYHPGDPNLLASMTYYWRIVEVGDPCEYTGPIWSFSTVSGKAQCSYPADGAVISGELYPFPPAEPTHIFTTMVFEPGPTVVKHVGYFSENYADVFNRVQDANLGPPPNAGTPGYETTYYAGMPLVEPAIDTLVRGTTYYWAVDETDPFGNVYPGDVWSFVVQDINAFFPSPPDEAIFIATDVLLSWFEGFGAQKHDVYLGTSWEDVNNAYFKFSNPFDVYQGTTGQGVLEWQCSGLPTDTKIYWRIDEVQGRFPPSPGTIYKGHVWEFTTTSANTGLAGEYYHHSGGTSPAGFESKVLVRIDPNINFDFSTDPPPGVRDDGFSVRWTGQIAVPQPGETYTFTTVTDDGARLWVNGQLIVDQWIDQGPTAHSGEIELDDYGPYNIEMEYYENDGGAVARLYWESSSTAYGIIPDNFLAPNLEAFTAYGPKPIDGSWQLNWEPVLSWGSALFAATHNLYFSTDFDAVNERNVAAIVGLTDPCYHSPRLDLDQTYYWAVDGVNTLGPAPNLWEGDVWSFTIPPGGKGSIIREWWLGITGGAVTALTNNAAYPDYPTGRELINIFEGPTGWADQYGSRIHGWLRPQKSGNYTFWIASDDNSDLLLSPNEDPADANRIAMVPGWTNSRVWAKFPEQQSDPITLQAGKKYYIAALHKEAGGGDNIAVAWQGPGIPVLEVIDGEYLSATPHDPPEAYGPYPADGATDVEDRSPILSWSPGFHTQAINGHHLYFSPTFADVNERKPAADKGVLTEPNYPYPPPPLLLDQTYYWAVDEVNSLGPAPYLWKGRVWSFTTAPCISLDNMEDYNDRGQIRGVWTDGYASVAWGGIPLGPLNAASSGSNLNVSTGVGSPLGATGPIHGGAQAMVLRYDNDGHTYPVRGEEDWDYDASTFSEIEANTVENLGVVQDWSGEGAKSLTMWFKGHPISDGSSEFGSWPEFSVTGRGRDIQGGHDEFYFLALYPWEAEPLATTTHIQTRVVSMDNTNPWAKAGLMIREKMTPYSRYAAVFVTPGNGITFQWRDVEGGPSGYAVETSRTAPQYLKLERTSIGAFIASYSSTGESWDWADVNVSENPDVTFKDVPMDDPCLYAGAAVTSHDSTQLCTADFNNWDAYPWPSTWVWGNVGLNAPERLYVALEDTVGNISVVEHDDVNAATLDSWQEWNVELTEFTTVNLSAVKKVRIGLGDRDDPQLGGSGALYIDDIRACPPRCVPAYGQPIGDIAEPYDCIVDEKDLMVLVGEWLVEATDPGTGNLVGWWKLDDATGATAQDSSIYGNHGTLIGTSDWVTGRIGGALHFDGIDDYVDCANDVSLQITGTAISLAAWVKYDTAEDYSAIAMKTTSGEWDDGYGLYANIDSVNFYVTYYGFAATKSFAADDQWHHVVGTYNGSNVRIWVDGVEGTPLSYTESISDTGHSFEIGRGASNAYNFSGAVDDVRLYNVALTDTEILGLLGLRSDLYEDMKINFMDYALIADQYLEEILWP